MIIFAMLKIFLFFFSVLSHFIFFFFIIVFICIMCLVFIQTWEVS